MALRTPRWLRRLGSSCLIGGQALAAAARGRVPIGELSENLMEAGPSSFLVVLIIGMAAGTVFNIQVAAELTKQGAGSTVGGILVLGLAREIAPLLTAMLLTGKVATAYAASLGTMKVTEQIDALRTLATHPTDYLVAPRLLATLIALPLLTAEAIALGMVSGMIVAVYLLGLDPVFLWTNMVFYTWSEDVMMGLIKAFIFAGIIATVSCYKGMNCGQGAEGVGRATTQAVVTSSIIILISNFFVTLILNKILIYSD